MKNLSVCNRWLSVSQRAWRISKVIFKLHDVQRNENFEFLDHQLVRKLIRLCTSSLRHVEFCYSNLWWEENLGFVQFDHYKYYTNVKTPEDCLPMMKNVSNLESIFLTLSCNKKKYICKDGFENFFTSNEKLKKVDIKSKIDFCLKNHIELHNLPKSLESLKLEKIEMKSTQHLSMVNIYQQYMFLKSFISCFVFSTVFETSDAFEGTGTFTVQRQFQRSFESVGTAATSNIVFNFARKSSHFGDSERTKFQVPWEISA